MLSSQILKKLLIKSLTPCCYLSPLLANWIQDFITQRMQSDVIKGNISTPCMVTSGVPQGSVLGPTLPIIYK